MTARHFKPSEVVDFVVVGSGAAGELLELGQRGVEIEIGDGLRAGGSFEGGACGERGRSPRHARRSGQLSALAGKLHGDKHSTLRMRPVVGPVSRSFLRCDETAPYRFRGFLLRVFVVQSA